VFTGFKNEVLQVPGVASLTASSTVPGEEIYWTNSFRAARASSDTRNTLYILGMDAEFANTYDLKMVAGRNFDLTDKKTAMLNEAAAKLLGFENPEAAIGQQIIRGRRDTMHICGVVRNFHQQGLQKAVDPMCLRYTPDQRNNFSLKLKSGTDLPATLSKIEAAWKSHFPGDPFAYFFLDEFFDRQYKTDLQFGGSFCLFPAFALLVASYVVSQRTKEIGIRKVLGASVTGITSLLAKDFLKLVLVAIVVASPVAYYFMEKWLSDFAYRIHMEWWMFAAAGILAMLIAFLTVGAQSVRAALANPVRSLRSE
jgi:putative ABC transport system permease protein